MTGNTSGAIVIGGTLRVEVITLSSALFQYRRSVELAQYQQNGLAEPVQVFSNVHGGYGIFGACNTASVTVGPEDM